MSALSFCSLHSLRAAVLAAASFACTPALFAADAATAPLIGEGATAITGRDLVTETSTLDAMARQRVLASPENVQRLGTEMYIRRTLAAKAVEQKIDQDPDVQQLLHVVRERVLSDALVRRNGTQALPTSPVLENLAQQNYKANPARFQQPERVRVRHIVIPLKTANAQSMADTIRKQALNGGDFAKLAQAHSKDVSSASKGGDWGLLTRDRMPPKLGDAAFALTKPGEISELVETDLGVHILQLVEKRPAGLQPFDEVKAALIEEATANISSNAHQALVGPIADTATPHKEAIEAFSDTYRK